MGLADNEPPETAPQPAPVPAESSEAALKRIEEKLATVEKKLSDKWILPVSLAVLSAILTFGNYFVQRLFLNSDVFKNEVNKSNANFKSRSTSVFYQQCHEKLDTIDKSFQSYCLIGPSAMEDSIITAKQVQLTSLIDHQFPLDPKVKQNLQDYISFVSNKLVDFENEPPDSLQLKNTYHESEQLYDKAVTEINAAFLNPER